MTAPSSTSSRNAFGFDPLAFLLIVFLAVWGIFSIASATRPDAGAVAATFSDANKQIVFVVLGLLALIGVALVPFRWFLHLQNWIYGVNLVFLLAVLKLAPKINGARSWIEVGPIRIQPSEFAKFAILVCLAAYWTRRQEKSEDLRALLGSLLYVAPALGLVLLQPDFGTAMAIVTIWLGVTFFAGARWTHLLAICVIGSLLFAGVWRGGVLQKHQKERLAVFLNPELDKQGAGYQLEQAQIAIGAGGATGAGYGKGLQNRAHYVPENQTDFIFTVVAEEQGFLGALVLIVCYVALLSRIAGLAGAADNYFGALLCGGFAALLAFHCLVNIGMNLRMMPVTGVPLPYFSYGGSSFLSFCLCAGVCQSVGLHRR